ncbi:MAG TPA: polyprenyl synthetase family protein, partial [Streptosporangiaceae bacterium]|nr:polyprenyl synthetase family protein [Streptosporangiaceae bacterium]
MVEQLARATLERARDHLLGLQHADGWWQGELETNVTMDAEDLFLREFLGLHDDAVVASAGRWIRSQQRDDGTWANFYGGPGDLSTTVEAYLALRLAGDEPDATHMKQACACSIGAVHLGAPPTLAMALAGFGAHVGLAFQLTDDLLGIWGAPEVTGKPVRADLRARKKSLPVVAALNSGQPEAAELRALLTSPEALTEGDLVRAADLVVAAGGKDWAESEADAQLAAANASLASIDLAADVRAE